MYIIFFTWVNIFLLKNYQVILDSRLSYLLGFMFRFESITFYNEQVLYHNGLIDAHRSVKELRNPCCVDRPRLLCEIIQKLITNFINDEN